MQYRLMILAISTLFFVGCAGSASHKVVMNDLPQDQNLSCPQADAEILRAQSIISGVNDDKAEISGADFMDGILWFPFNLIAKESNYNNALSAANQRIMIMRQLKQDKNCPEQQIAQQGQTQQSLNTKIRELNQLYKDGLLTEAEYLAQKKRVLDSI
jgi:hypothetical protein